MKEPLMSIREFLTYFTILGISIFSIWLTLQIFHTDSVLWRIMSLIPAGLITSTWVAMNVGMISALKYRDPSDE